MATILAGLPQSLEAGIAIVQHLDVYFAGELAGWLNEQTELTVVLAQEGMRVQADHVYVIPPNRYLSIEKRVLHAIEPAPGMRIQAPIDRFFHDLAQDLEDRAISIVLSGTGTDGTRGLKAVKERGGFTLVQDPATAQHDGMPRSAIERTLPALDLPDPRGTPGGALDPQAYARFAAAASNFR